MDPFCTHPEVLVYHRWGLNLNKAVSEFCGEDLKLRVPKEEASEKTPDDVGTT